MKKKCSAWLIFGCVLSVVLFLLFGLMTGFTVVGGNQEDGFHLFGREIRPIDNGHGIVRTGSSVVVWQQPTYESGDPVVYASQDGDDISILYFHYQEEDGCVLTNGNEMTVTVDEQNILGIATTEIPFSAAIVKLICAPFGLYVFAGMTLIFAGLIVLFAIAIAKSTKRHKQIYLDASEEEMPDLQSRSSFATERPDDVFEETAANMEGGEISQTEGQAPTIEEAKAQEELQQTQQESLAQSSQLQQRPDHSGVCIKQGLYLVDTVQQEGIARFVFAGEEVSKLEKAVIAAAVKRGASSVECTRADDRLTVQCSSPDAFLVKAIIAILQKAEQ